MSTSSFDTVKRILSVNLVFSVIILIDFISYGRLLFSPGNIDRFDFEIFSQTLFYFANIFSQLIYSLLTKIESGLYAGAIIENVIFIKKIQNIVLEEAKKENAILSFFISNILPLLFFSCLLYALFSYLLAYFNISSILTTIPKETLNAFIIGIGIFQIYAAIDCLIVKKSAESIMILGRHVNPYILILMVAHGTLLFLLDIYFDGHYLLTPLFTLISTSIMFLLSALFIGTDIFFYLKKIGILRDDKVQTVLYFKEIVTAFQLGNFRWSFFLKGLPTAISMGLMSLIHLPINYSTYRNCLPKNSEKSNFKRELYTQSLANTVLSIFCVPQYLVGSYSIIYSKIGGNSKLISLSLFLSLVPVFYIGNIVLPFFPKYIYSAIPFMFGLFFIKEGLNDFILYFQKTEKDSQPVFTEQCKCYREYEKRKLQSDYFTYFTVYDIILLLSVLFLFLYFDSNPLIALFFGLSISYLYSKLYTINKGKETGKIECETECIFNYECKEKIIYWEPTVIAYYNIGKIENTIGAVNLTSCRYIDWYSRMRIREKVRDGELLVFVE